MRRGRREAAPERKVDYRNLKNPFPPMTVFTDDRIAAIHEASLSAFDEFGIKVLLPEARKVFKAGGAKVDETTEMVYFGREVIEAAVASAPKSFRLMAGARDRDLQMELGSLIFQPGAGAPHATDLERGRRPGSERDFRELIKLTQHFDVLQMMPPLIEPQDVATNVRHYMTLEAQLTLSDKFPFVFSRGTPQVMQSLELLQAFRGLSDDEFAANPHCYTIINTNSPRQLDIPMAQGLIDFARARQVSIITPFTLMGAMAPITVAGALTLSHAEALAAITLTQLVSAGAPVCYGTFTSNVDMKSGAPTFGTPEHFQASLAAGQLARMLGLPWRSASGSGANMNDVQAANETQFGTWGCLMAGATVVIHSAGWLEGGLTVSYEKLVTDVEVLNMVAEMCAATPAGDAEIAMEALADVQPGGHFFGTQHTMDRYQTQFYEPVVHDFANFGTWRERGSIDTNARATGVWKGILENFKAPAVDQQRVVDLHASIRKMTEAGGAEPES